jgi:hypothetical protein
MRWQANTCRTFSGGSAVEACATRTGSTALGAGQRSVNVSACASVAVQIAATVRTARITILASPIGFPCEETGDLGVLSPNRFGWRRKHRDAGMMKLRQTEATLGTAGLGPPFCAKQACRCRGAPFCCARRVIHRKPSPRTRRPSRRCSCRQPLCRQQPHTNAGRVSRLSGSHRRWPRPCRFVTHAGNVRLLPLSLVDSHNYGTHGDLRFSVRGRS